MQRVEPIKRVTQAIAIRLMLIVVSMLFASCAHQYGFTIQRLYSHREFGGKSLDRTIIMGPLLTGNGPDTSGYLSLGSQLKAVRRFRPELQLTSKSPIADKYLELKDTAGINAFYHSLYSGDLLTSQNASAAWKSAGPNNYFMVVRLRSAMKVKSFDRSTKRRIQIEGELWDCDSMEVIWRIAVNGVSRDERIGDTRFLLDAIGQVYRALPTVVPGYESGKW